MSIKNVVESVGNLSDESSPAFNPKKILPLTYLFDPIDVPLPAQDFGDDLFDPTGFIPLEVMIEQQRIAGRKALIQRSMFDFDDWKDIYLDTEPPVDFEDDFQVMEYIKKVEEKKQKLFEERQKELNSEFSEFLASKRKQNATTTINDDDANISSNEESQTPLVSDLSSTEV